MSKIEAYAEFREAPAAVERQAQALAAPLSELVARLQAGMPQVVLTCARGSSAHAATFGKHLIERHLGIAVAAMAPNIATIYRRELRLAGQLFLAISQSGRSDDLVESSIMAKRAGALTATILNEMESPLARACDIVLPMAAGPEAGILATKSFVATMAALLRLVAAWGGDAVLAAAIERLPDRLTAAAELDWSAGLAALTGATSTVVLGRGTTLAVAREAALKLKEGCDLHAEAFSGAEFLHGPIALLAPRYPILMLMPTDAAAAGMLQLAANLGRKGAAVLRAGPGEAGAIGLPTLPPDHADADAVALIQSFYGFLLKLAARRGTDVGTPRHLQKITRTR
jgi:glucosamine--fructose-6-phosphate aminotransferase (isomerizing)